MARGLVGLRLALVMSSANKRSQHKMILESNFYPHSSWVLVTWMLLSLSEILIRYADSTEFCHPVLWYTTRTSNFAGTTQPTHLSPSPPCSLFTSFFICALMLIYLLSPICSQISPTILSVQLLSTVSMSSHPLPHIILSSVAGQTLFTCTLQC